MQLQKLLPLDLLSSKFISFLHIKTNINSSLDFTLSQTYLQAITTVQFLFSKNDLNGVYNPARKPAKIIKNKELGDGPNTLFTLGCFVLSLK